MPHNLSLVVSGKFIGGTESLLSVIQKDVEPSLLERGYDKGPHPSGWVRPFLETITAERVPFKSQTADVKFPEKDESMGELLLVFKGPSAGDNLTRKVRKVFIKEWDSGVNGCLRPSTFYPHTSLLHLWPP